MKHLSISNLLFLVLVLLLAVSNASLLDTSPENHDNHDDSNLLKPDPDSEGSIIRLPTETNLPQLNPTTSLVVDLTDFMNRRPVYHHNRFNKFPRRCHHHHHLRSGSMDEVVELEIISSLKDYRRKHLRSNRKYGYDRRRGGKVDDETVEEVKEEYKGEWKGGRPYRHHHHDHDHDHDDHGHDHHDKYKRPENKDNYIVKRIRKFLSRYLNW